MLGGFTISSFINKDVLFWTPLGMDVLLAAGTYPTFLMKGKSFFLKNLKMSQEEVAKAEESKAAHSLWHLVMIAYSGYSFLLASSTLLSYHYEPARKATGAAMLALMFTKKFALKDPNLMQGNKEMQESKDGILMWFYFPFYGGYCLWNLYEFLYC